MLAVVGWPQAAEAQLDPLLLLKRSLPSITTPQYRANVLVAVDVAPRMQYDADGNYYDPTEYVRGNLWDIDARRHRRQHDRALSAACTRACSGARRRRRSSTRRASRSWATR